ncbi:hypothetical protein GCM10010909_07660 [Acidocella aquatica]|uniref:Uncharacterized protein n=1 Tax=Acidocella aquatica TaxID=1922313 RepID=A0ABQ6A414_9PROT|nr:hypothetical protein [Acidocella aquatica]GLR66088.1 hypothetical protein GCM10010909_07660 [Acidocella aquatica]
MPKLPQTPADNKRNLRPLDLKRAAAHLLSRAEWLRRRREPDPRCRAVQLADAAECCRLAAALTGGKK